MTKQAVPTTSENSETDLNNTIHFVLQGKGGIGKSLVTSIIAQYLTSKLGTVLSFDTDQENTTLLHYKKLNVEHIPLMNSSRIIDSKKLDILMEKLLSSEKCCVVDNGANTFSPLLAYFIENQCFEMLRDAGKKVFIHTIIGGGDTLVDTATGFNSIAQGLTDTPIILWLNEFFGDLALPSGEKLEDLKVYKQNAKSVDNVVFMQARNPQTFGSDIKKMNTKRLTLDEILVSTEFGIMEKQRLKTVFRDIYSQLDKFSW